MAQSLHRLLPAIACAILANPMPPEAMVPIEHDLQVDGGRWFRQRRGKGLNNRRGKGQRNPPKARSNRLHISKRVRRKHRRAA